MAQMDGVSRTLLRSAMNAPFLEREEERKLALRWRDQRDEHALHQLAHAHMRLVMAIASRFRHYGLPASDLVQEGHIGLLEAAVRFEPERDVRFSTYATWWIRAAIQDHVLRNWSIVRGGTSSAQKSLFFNLRRLRAKLSRRAPSDTPSRMFSDIAIALGVPLADVEAMSARLSAPDASLDAPVGEGEDSATRGDFMVDSAPLPDVVVEQRIDYDRRLESLRAALGVLNARELHIVKARRLSEDAVTLESLGEQLGISKERVRQIENRAVEKLRNQMLGAPM